MELIYSMRRKPLKCEPPHFETSSDPEVVRPICNISACNIIAFSSPTELSDSDGCTWGGHVYVCDLDTPWDSHKVTSTVHPVSALEWDSEGKQLLVATTEGEVSVFGMKEFLLNEWSCLYTASFPGEHVIKAAFFHNGRRVSCDKKPDVPAAERLQLLRPTPTLKGFGGIACEGACIITATGLIGALTPSGEPGKALSGAECLRPARDRVPTASVAHKNGTLIVAAGGVNCVRCAVCSVTLSRAPHQAPALLVQPLPAVYLDYTPVSLTWSLREDTDSLLVGGSALSVWNLTQRAHPVHKLLSKGPLQGSTTPGGGQKPGSDCFNTVVWQQISVLPVEGCAHVCSRRLHAAAPYHILAATGPNRLYLHRDTHRISTTAVTVSGLPGLEAGATPPKKPKYGSALATGAACAIVSCVDMSWLGGVCVCVDTHAQLHVYRLPAPDISTPLLVQHTTSLLEYAMVSGLDYRDIIMTLKPNAIDAVYERFTESFQRQPQAFQQFYYQNWLKLRIGLCRVIPTAQGAVSSLTQLMTLAGAWAALAAALRGDDRRHDDVRLDALLEHEHDKALVTLEAKAELSSDAVALTPLRRILQQCVDIATTHLQHAATGHTHPYETWTEGTALALLRKLVVGARAAGRAAAGEPLSRALARLALHNTKEVREECATLCLQLTTPRIWESLPRCTVSAPHGKPWPHYFEYGIEPEGLRYAPEPPNYGTMCEVMPSLGMDCIRYMYLGPGAGSWRACARCGARALAAARAARAALARAYDARFLPACRCGGKWTLVSNY
ncbi:mediator of RNA polymerase II transcription subunit 16 [Leguminivora glycinivorella]|uniref:mediator of RNA polymerase II transcription subunit 16 n=1 Tax=Leguminivora glycinivorella TaxID=1035111 RepID=UPI00200DC663|nr:mediator of RNA polymerase II transcription subunit 16 [Leguminivora glycinivorella]